MIEDNVEVTVTNVIDTITIFPSITDEVVDINILDNREDVNINVTESVVEVNINKVTNILSAVWGEITGTLSDQTDLQSALNAKVPYTGATGNVNLGEWGVKVGYLGFDTTPTGTPTGIGTTYWDAANRTLSLIDGDGDTTLQIGQEERVLVHNNTGATLTEGQVVYVTGSTGELPSVALAVNSTDSTSSVTFGVITETIAHGSDGFITTSGIVHGLNTLAFTEGAAIWLGSVAGTFTDVKPIAPAHSVLVGYVIKKAGGNGSIFVKIQNGVELEELHNVLITSVANNQGLFYESSTSLWKNKTIATVLGYTPISLSSLSASSPLAYNSGTGAFSIQVASGSQNGYLSSTDWTTFNNKANALSGTINTLTYWASSTTIGSLALATYPSLTEISYVKGVTSAIQTQLNAKIGGSGTSNYIPKFNGSGTSITNSLIYDNGTIGINTTTPTAGVVLTLKESASLGSALSLLNRNSTQNWKIAVDVAAVDDKYLAFIDNTTATAKMVIGQNGNVGIGTSAPSTKLQVAGSNSQAIAYFYNNSGSAGNVPGVYIEAGTNSSDYALSVNSSLGTSYLRVRGDGNVGIGTSAPSEKLQVIGNMLLPVGNSLYFVPGLTTYGIGTPNSSGVQIFAGAGDAIRFGQMAAGSVFTERVRIADGGSVGIGTSAPQSLLHVSGVITFGGDTRYGVSKIYNSAVGDGFGFEQVSSAQTGLSGAATRIFTANGGSNYISLGKYTTATAFTDWLFINQSGSVGIGTNAPAASSLLDVTSTTKGFLPPRMTNTQRLAISSPAVGLVVFVTTTLEEGLWVYHSTGWVNYNLI